MEVTIQNKFRNLTIWQKKGMRAPHKPLMLLIALGRFQNGIHSFTYKDIEQQLKDLLVKYGPQRKTYKPEEPFWRLGHNEGVFKLANDALCPMHKDKGTSRTALIEHNVSAQFVDELSKFFVKHPSAISEIATDLVNNHFQPSYLEDLFFEVGLSQDFNPGSARKRSPDFRKRVLKAYEDRCAVCGFHMLFNQQPIGLEAAHIKWHNAGGPDTENNGLALCSMHHKLFDYGVFMIEPSSYKIKLSDSVSCFNSAEAIVKDFHNKDLDLPENVAFYPNEQFLLWHAKEKFKGQPRP